MKIMEEMTRPRRDRNLCPKINTGEGITEQSHADSCNINLILRDYARTGFIKHANKHQGTYDDVTSVDFQESLNTVANVKTMFEQLPSEIRKEFDGNPSNFLDYVQDPSNIEELAQRNILVGNDGIDITGAYSKATTRAQYLELMATRKAAREIEAAAAAAVSEQTSESASEQP